MTVRVVAGDRAPRRRTVLAVGVLILLIAGQVGVRRRVAAARNAVRDGDVALAEVISPGERIGAALLGGFRSILLNILWVRTQNLREKHQYLSLPIYYKAIEELQGNSSSLYWIQAENMTLDIPHALTEDPEERWKWIVRGVAVLEEGRRRFPHNATLLWHGATLYKARFVEEYAVDDLARYRAEFDRDPIDITLDYAEAALSLPEHELLLHLLYLDVLFRKEDLLFPDKDDQEQLSDADVRDAYRTILEKERWLLNHWAAHELTEEESGQLSGLERSLTLREDALASFEEKLRNPQERRGR